MISVDEEGEGYDGLLGLEPSLRLESQFAQIERAKTLLMNYEMNVMRLSIQARDTSKSAFPLASRGIYTAHWAGTYGGRE